VGRDDSELGERADSPSPAAVEVQTWRLVPAGLNPKIVVGSLALAPVGALLCATSSDSDGGSDGIALSRLVAFDAAHLRWQFGIVVVALAGLHYVASAIAARAAAGIALPVGELLLIQLAAAAANRVTPGGIGGKALTTRYLTRRGLRLSAALGAVSALILLGAVADLLVLIVVVTLGRWFALPVGVGALGSRLRQLRPPLTVVDSPWLWAASIGAIAGAVWLIAHRYRDRMLQFGRDIVSPVGQLAADPRRLVTLLVASGCTTLILAFAFAATTAMVPGPHPHAGLGVLVVAFMLGSAAASAVPIPSGLGSTEAALVAVLAGVGVPVTHAIQVVLVYRVVTFWAPAVLGVLVARRLHRLVRK
jgi:uncharacterized membrane protein YbhN (UPF0104 family)